MLRPPPQRQLLQGQEQEQEQQGLRRHHHRWPARCRRARPWRRVAGLRLRLHPPRRRRTTPVWGPSAHGMTARPYSALPHVHPLCVQ
jgi:hypothetical protein